MNVPRTITSMGRRVEGRARFLDHLDSTRGGIDERVGRHIALHVGDDREIAAHFRGGKRLRAGTALLLYDALDDEEGKGDMVLDLAAAVEFAHGISLMVDDILDGDGTRRGGASVHAAKGTRCTMLEAVRLLAVPYALAAPHGPAVTSLLASAHEEMVRGAITELEATGAELGRAGYERLISMKSGGLFELAARFGALAAGCCEEKAALAGGYGSGLGTVHQFSDDIADLRSALSAGREVSGSEGCLLRLMVKDPQERTLAVERGRLAEGTERELETELQSHVSRAERAARRLAGSVGKCGGRNRMEELLPALVSAPGEIAGLMLSSGQNDGA
ncbi:MAG: polyprenyl synthetase family protein [Methanomassiliicoccus sp.]|nr:polyprenyl synthetase family protein [Methanomassiliicoccus sp.]